MTGPRTVDPMFTGDGDSDVRVPAAVKDVPPEALIDRAATKGIPPEAPVSEKDRAALAPDGANRAAGLPDSTRPQATVAETLAEREGRTDLAPLGDPDAPQGTGREQNTALPENRPAPAGNVRFAQADPRHEPEHGE